VRAWVPADGGFTPLRATITGFDAQSPFPEA
jgi:hypothetical protein